MNDPFTKNHFEQIKAAANKINYGNSAAEMLITELQPTQYHPVIGEIVCSGERDHYWKWKTSNILASWPEVRSLKMNEVPEWDTTINIAIVALYKLTASFSNEINRKECAKIALEQLKKIRDANSCT